MRTVRLGSFILAVITLLELWWIIILLIVLVIVVLLTFIAMGKYFEKIRNFLDEMNAITKENLAGIRVVKSLKKEHMKVFFAKKGSMLNCTTINL